jgi:hypothetical protein
VLVAYVVLLVGLPSTLIIPQLGGSTTPALLAGLLFLLWWAAGRQIPGLGLATGPQPMRVLIGFFAASVVASYASGALGDLTSLQTRAVDRGLIFIFALCGITLLAADGLRTRKQLDAVLTALVIMGTLSAFLGALSFFFNWYPIQHLHVPGLQVRGDIAFRGVRSDLPRVAGTAAHPIEFGVMMAMVLPLALREAFRRVGRQRMMAWAAVALIGLGIAVSLSRSAMLGTVCALVILLVSWPPRRRLMFLATVPLYILALKIVKPRMLGTLLHLFTRAASDDSLVHRTNNYRRIGSMMAHHWLVGTGFGSYVPTRATEILDNAYLGHLVETGIIGVTALLVLLGGGFLMANSVRRRGVLVDDRDRGAALTASMAVVVPSLFTFDAFGYSMASATVWLLLGCCAAAWRISRTMPAETPEDAGEHAMEGTEPC